MDVFSYTISKVFSDGGKIHYVLPHFQREYRWERKNWDTLLEDAFQIYDAFDEDDGKIPEHFLGALVVLPDGNIGLNVPVHRLVDGQQRLTTLSILLCAFGRLIESSEPELSSEIHSYLFNNNQKDNGRFKLLPTMKNGDRAAYQAVLEDKPIPQNQSRIPEAFNHFHRTLKDRLSANELDTQVFFKVLTQAMQVVCISLNANENAYQIFESLNNKAEPLKQSDLVRNYIAMRLSSGKQEEVFHEHWAPIENLLDDNQMVGRIGELTAFLRHYDAMRAGTLPSEKHVYARFRDEMKRVPSEVGLISELATLRRFASYYDNFLRPDKGTQPALKTALKRLEALDITTAFPFFLAIADHCERGVISLDEYVAGCAIVENYMVRRFLVDARTNFLNKMFAALPRAINWNDFLPSLRANLASLQYPSNARIRQVFPGRALYDKNNTRTIAKLVMLFETLNRRLYQGSDVVPQLESAPTIEHILPQTLSDWWENHLGENADAIANEWKHTVGNLALVTQSYNSSLSNDSFPEKRTRLIEHGLKFNSEYFARPIKEWNAEMIQERAAWLTDLILQIWPSFAPASDNSETGGMSTPVLLRLDGQTIAVDSWRDVFRQTAKYIQTCHVNFSVLENTIPQLIRSTPFSHASFNLKNGYFLNMNWSDKATRRNCEDLLQAAGLGDVEWKVELND